MTKVITYGTYDLLHYGHIRLLERARELGDYLIVGVTSEDFDKTRGKINVQQSLAERIEAVRSTGLADEIIVEEYEGQKIDDIKKYDIDIFTVGSDWVGYFDYLKEYCTVIYLDRTEGISSTELRQKTLSVKLGLVGDSLFLNKVIKEAAFVNGISISSICTRRKEGLNLSGTEQVYVDEDFDDMLERVDAIYLRSHPKDHYSQIKTALEKGKHVLCESPMVTESGQTAELFKLAREKGLILMEAIKTAYSTAYERMLLLVKTGKIGEVTAVSSTCTSMSNQEDRYEWNCIYEWGPTALLPVFQILGNGFKARNLAVKYADPEKKQDVFEAFNFIYPKAVANVVIGTGVKSEGELIISGTRGYVYVPSPWWKTDYFEIRYENQSENRRYFYQLDGEGIRYELVTFSKCIDSGKTMANITESITESIAAAVGSLGSASVLE